MHSTVQLVEAKYKKKKVPVVKPGDIVKVTQKIREGGKEKTQAFQGIVIDVKKPNELNYSIVVRKVSLGVGVEKTFPMHAPMVQEVEVLKRSKVRRANLRYLRNLADKKTRSKLKSKELKELSFIIPKEEETTPMPDQNEESKKELEVEGHAEAPLVEERLDAEVTEISEGQDATEAVVTSTEQLAKKEDDLASVGTDEHRTKLAEEDEQTVTAEAIQEAVDKTEDETTNDQNAA